MRKQLMSQRQNRDRDRLEYLGSVHVKLNLQPLRSNPENPFCSLLQVHNLNVRSMRQELHHLIDAISQLGIL